MKNKNFTLVVVIAVICISILAIPTCRIMEPAANGNDPIDPEKVMQEMFYRNCMKDGNEHLVPDWFREQYEKEYSAAATVPENPSTTQKPVKQYYPDVSPDAWYADAVNAMTKGNLLKGYDDSLFHPDDIITGGQFATILCRIGGADPSNEHFAPHDDYDKPINWAHWACRLISQSKVAYRISPKRANNNVLRGEAIAVFSSLAYKMPKYHESQNGIYSTTYPIRQVSEKVWTENDIPDYEDTKLLTTENTAGICDGGEAIVEAYNLGIVNGIDDLGTCNPLKPITRAELCQILYNMGVFEEDSVAIYSIPFKEENNKRIFTPAE